jgi:hypothetical protein
VDCVQTQWASWGSCSATCGGGKKVRTRTTTTEASCGGTACGPTREEVPCNTQACANIVGCTPGFWKNHLELWTSLQNADFDTTFGVNYFNPDKTLLQAIQLTGQPFAFHAVAAYLSSIYITSPNTFTYTTSQVIQIVRDGVNSGDINGAATLLAAANERGTCPLGGGAATRP